MLWQRLYNTVWLAFLSCVLVPRWMGEHAGPPVHALLGLAVLAMTFFNARSLAAAAVPPRLRRISRATAGIAAFQALAGIALAVLPHAAPDLPVAATVLHGAHVVCALTILAQASSVATAYDMWEEKECIPSAPEAQPDKG